MHSKPARAACVHLGRERERACHHNSRLRSLSSQVRSVQPHSHFRSSGSGHRRPRRRKKKALFKRRDLGEEVHGQRHGLLMSLGKVDLVAIHTGGGYASDLDSVRAAGSLAGRGGAGLLGAAAQVNSPRFSAAPYSRLESTRFRTQRCLLPATLQMRMEQHSKPPIRPDIDARTHAFHSGQVRMGNLDAYSRHKEYINNYVNFYGTKKPPEPQQNYKTDVDVLRENWRSPLDPPHTIHARGSDSNGCECARARVLTLRACVGGWARVATDGRQESRMY